MFKVGDKVRVIAGKGKKQEGVVKKYFPKTERVIVEGINVITKHIKPTQEKPQGGIIKEEGTIHKSNVMLIDPKNKKMVTRIGLKYKGKKKLRFAIKSGTFIDKG